MYIEGLISVRTLSRTCRATGARRARGRRATHARQAGDARATGGRRARDRRATGARQARDGRAKGGRRARGRRATGARQAGDGRATGARQAPARDRRATGARQAGDGRAPHWRRAGMPFSATSQWKYHRMADGSQMNCEQKFVFLLQSNNIYK